MIVVFLSVWFIFEFIQQATLANFMLFLNIFKILKISFWTLWRKNCISLPLWALFSLKPCKTFKIAQCKQPRLVKPCLNSDLYFIFKTSSIALLETIVSYSHPPSLSKENTKNVALPPAPLDLSATALMCIFFSILNCS